MNLILGKGLLANAWRSWENTGGENSLMLLGKTKMSDVSLSCWRMYSTAWVSYFYSISAAVLRSRRFACSVYDRL